MKGTKTKTTTKNNHKKYNHFKDNHNKDDNNKDKGDNNDKKGQFGYIVGPFVYSVVWCTWSFMV